jgi:hypothetical protein
MTTRSEDTVTVLSLVDHELGNPCDKDKHTRKTVCS